MQSTKLWRCLQKPGRYALVAGMVDAHGSDPCVRKDVRVRLPPGVRRVNRPGRRGRLLTAAHSLSVEIVSPALLLWIADRVARCPAGNGRPGLASCGCSIRPLSASEIIGA